MPNSASDDASFSGQTLRAGEMHVMPRVPPWGPFIIALLLMAIAGYALLVSRAEPMAGIIIGYVAAYWLPGSGPRLSRQSDG